MKIQHVSFSGSAHPRRLMRRACRRVLSERLHESRAYVGRRNTASTRRMLAAHRRVNAFFRRQEESWTASANLGAALDVEAEVKRRSLAAEVNRPVSSWRPLAACLAILAGLLAFFKVVR